MRMARWRGLAVLALAAVMGPPASAGSTSAPTAGGKDTAAATAPKDRLRLASQTSWVRPGEEMVLRLGVSSSAPPDQVELAVAVYRRVMNRSEFAQTLTGRLRGLPLTVTPPTPLSQLATDAAGAIVVRLPLQDPALPPDRARLRLVDQGVYPVRVEIRRTGADRALATLVTHLVYTTPPGDGGFPLKVALVLPVHAPPALQPDGKRLLSPKLADGLGELAGTIQAYPLVPLTLLPTPETLDALQASSRAQDRETVAGLAGATQGRQVAGGAYVPLNLRDLMEARLESEAAVQLDRGTQTIERVMGVRTDSRTWVTTQPLDEPAVLQLREQQVDRLVLPDDAMVPVDLPITLAQPFDLEVRGVRRPQVLSADTALGAHFARSDDPVLAAHRLLADLAVVYGDRPSRPRVVVAMAPRSWRPSKAFLDALLAGMSTSSILTGSTLDDGFASVPPATSGKDPLIRRLAPPATTGALPAGSIRAARARLGAFTTIIDASNPLDDAIEQLLLLAQGADVPSSRRTEFLRAVNRRIDGELGLIQVPPKRSVTLTARTGEIPVTLLNLAPYAVHLQLQVASEKLEFPDGASRQVDLTRRNTTERFSVRARTSGTFPLRLRLASPDGTMVLGRSRFTVRSTAASGVGVLLSAGAGAFLLLWWARHHARGRRNRRLVPM